MPPHVLAVRISPSELYDGRPTSKAFHAMMRPAKVYDVRIHVFVSLFDGSFIEVNRLVTLAVGLCGHASRILEHFTWAALDTVECWERGDVLALFSRAKTRTQKFVADSSLLSGVSWRLVTSHGPLSLALVHL